MICFTLILVAIIAGLMSLDFCSYEADTNDSRTLLRPPFLGLKDQSGADGYSCGALMWILAGALPSIGGAQVRITGAFRLEYSFIKERI